MKVTNYIFLTVLILVAIAGSVSAQAYLDEVFDQANEQYEQGQYAKAIETYEKVLSMGGATSDVYYNLGNAFYKDKQLGKAILNYERALVLDKRDTDAKENLRLAKILIQDKEPFIKKSVFSLPFRFIRDTVTLSETVWFCTLFFWLLMISLSCMLFASSKYVLWKRISFFFAIVLCIGLLSLGMLVHGKEKSPPAIVMVSETSVMSGPGEQYTESFTLHEGTKVYIDEKKFNWYKVHLANKMTGWLKEETLERI